jgi:hypothetical protein
MRVADGARKINSHGGAIHLHIGGRQSLFPASRALYPRAPEPQAPMAPIEVRDYVCSFSDQMLVRHEVAISTVILEFMRSPCVLPQVPYQDAHRWQQRGAELSGQYNADSFPL